MEFVIFHPKANEETMAYNKAADPTPTLSDLIIEINASIFKIPKGLFKYCFMGKLKVHLIPDNFKNAAMDPVKVIPPIRVPKNAAIRCRVVWSISIQNEPKEVTTAARPTKA